MTMSYWSIPDSVVKCPCGWEGTLMACDPWTSEEGTMLLGCAGCGRVLFEAPPSEVPGEEYAEEVARQLLLARSKLYSVEHARKVAAYLAEVSEALVGRGRVHDLSKTEEPELSMFAIWGPRLAQLEYGTKEYGEALEKMGEALQHHYQENRHHPESVFSREKWIPIKGFDGYEVSSFGRIRSLDRVVVREGGRGDLFVRGKVLRTNRTPKGYRRIQLSRGGDGSNLLVHRLVAEAFIDNPDGKPEVNHKDGDKENNKVDNLEWVTASENQRHAYRAGLKMAAVKYVVFCDELNLATVGCCAMEAELRARGYEEANASSIFNCINGSSSKHVGLVFRSQPIESSSEVSPLDSMTLVDLVEMVCDWRAACQRTKNGDFFVSLAHNAKRFNLSPQIVNIISNTAREWGKE